MLINFIANVFFLFWLNYVDEKSICSWIILIMSSCLRLNFIIISLLTFSQLGCCGNIDYKDWYSLNPPRPVPRSCCKQPGPIRCDTQDETQIYNQGCYVKVTQYLERNMGRIAISSLVVAVFPLVGSILSIALAKNINKAKYEQMA